ncbi:Uncharacterized protein SCF082_LOCUS43039 [Durusdinium trenchii]|uniref:Uncharacterized protein n=1 Tax=Durusdinium trenchii TaxID=1381693 RepID=A0ABP0QSX9_9DINO
MASFQANNKKRCPAKTCKNEDTRWKLFAEYVEPGRSFNAVKAKFEQILGETQRTQVKYGFRNDQTVPDPGFPLVEFNIEDIKELRRITKIEMEGSLDQDGLKAFVDPSCLDGKQHLALGDMMGAGGVNKLTVVPEKPLDKAKALVDKILKDANDCRDYAFKLRPHAMSAGLIDQLTACAVSLSEQATKLQTLIENNANKNKHYAAIIQEATVVRKFASERVSLAKALIRAVQPKAKKNNKEKPAEGTDGDPKAPAP